MNLAASAWEFRHRFWIFVAWYWISFSLYRVDHRMFGQSLAEFFARLAHREVTLGGIRLVLVAGVVLAILAALLRTWATAYIHPEIMVDGAVHTHTVIAEGPYRFVRNPLYLGTNLLTLAYSVMASRVGAVVLVAGVFLFNYRLILREERELLQARGENYERFRRSVPRLWPSLRPRVVALQLTPNWGSGLLGEMFFWGLAFALLVFTVTFDIRAYFLALGLSLSLYFLCLAIVGFRRKYQS
ncbi:MAG TPA: methyltransferase [Candidatus Saccharimonadales bacterium]|nr:methyltransferase [Candidatus Saccharimonadales bacterium]